MDPMMLVLCGLVVGLLIAVLALVAIGNRTPTTVFVPPPPPMQPNQDSGCAGFLVSGVMVFMGLVFWLFILM